MTQDTTDTGRALSEQLNPGMEAALDARYGPLLPGMAAWTALGPGYQQAAAPGLRLDSSADDLVMRLTDMAAGSAFDTAIASEEDGFCGEVNPRLLLPVLALGMQRPLVAGIPARRLLLALLCGVAIRRSVWQQHLASTGSSQHSRGVGAAV